MFILCMRYNCIWWFFVCDPPPHPLQLSAWSMAHIFLWLHVDCILQVSSTFDLAFLLPFCCWFFLFVTGSGKGILNILWIRSPTSKDIKWSLAYNAEYLITIFVPHAFLPRCILHFILNWLLSQLKCLLGWHPPLFAKWHNFFFSIIEENFYLLLLLRQKFESVYFLSI